MGNTTKNSRPETGQLCPQSCRIINSVARPARPFSCYSQ